MTNNKKPKVSVVIVSDDHPPKFENFFYPLIKQDFDPELYEIVFVDVVGVTNYQPIIDQINKEKYPNLRFHFHKLENGNRAKGNNYAIKNSTGEIVVFLGDDLVAKTDFVKEHYHFHQDNRDEHIVGIGAALFAPKYIKNNHFAEWSEKSGHVFGLAFDSNTTKVPENFFYMPNSSVKRVLLEKTTLFDEDFPHHSWDDYEFGLRLLKQGMICKYAPKTAVEHHHFYTFEQRCETIRRAGESARIFEPKHPEITNWKKPLKKSTYRHHIAAEKYKLLHRIFSSEKYLIKYYKSKLDAAFCKGYREYKA